MAGIQRLSGFRNGKLANSREEEGRITQSAFLTRRFVTFTSFVCPGASETGPEHVSDPEQHELFGFVAYDDIPGTY